MNFFNSKLEKTQKGFTLIELLIVIVILGILATAVLVAMDPAEQINRGKDAGRISSVGQLGHAVQAFYTSQSSMPAAATWDTALTTSGEVKGFPTAPTGGTQCAVANNNKQGFCYVVIGLTDAVVYTNLQSKSNTTKVTNAGGTCDAANPTWAVFYTSAGKGGITCASEATVIAGTATLY